MWGTVDRAEGFPQAGIRTGGVLGDQAGRTCPARDGSVDTTPGRPPLLVSTMSHAGIEPPRLTVLTTTKPFRQIHTEDALVPHSRIRSSSVPSESWPLTTMPHSNRIASGCDGVQSTEMGREPPALSRRGPPSIQPRGFSARGRERCLPPHYSLTPPRTVVGHEPPADPAAITNAARMSRPGLDRAPGCRVGFADTRAMAARAEADQRVRAARLVAANSLDVNDCRELLCMLGLTAPSSGTAPAQHTRPSPSAGEQRPGSYRDISNAFHSTEGARE